MRINDKGAELARAEMVRSTRTAEVSAAGGEPVGAVATLERADRVQISDAGRALAARAEGAEEGAGTELTPERIAEVRRRILEGAYNSVEVAGQVARGILERGDL